jgi:hypothetical protein
MAAHKNNWKDNYLRPAAIGMRELRFPKYCGECGGSTKLKSTQPQHEGRIVCYACVIKEKAETGKIAVNQ